MKNKMMVAAILLGFGFMSGLAGEAQPQRGASSPPNPGIEARFSFGAGEQVNGTRVVRVFLELRNTADDDLTPVYLLYDSGRSVKAQLVDAGGKPVPLPAFEADILSPLPFMICLPRK